MSQCTHSNDAGGCRCCNQALDPIGHLSLTLGCNSESSARPTGNLLDWPQRVFGACTPRTQLKAQIRDRDQRCRLRFINRSTTTWIRTTLAGVVYQHQDIRAFSVVTRLQSLGIHLGKVLLGMVPQKRFLVVQARNLEVSGKIPKDSHESNHTRKQLGV